MIALAKNILYLEADGAYTKLFLNDGQVILSSKNLKTYEALLLSAGFFRTHHSFLANLTHITRYDKIESVLVLKNDIHIAVSFRKKEALLDRIKQISFL